MLGFAALELEVLQKRHVRLVSATSQATGDPKGCEQLKTELAPFRCEQVAPELRLFLIQLDQQEMAFRAFREAGNHAGSALWAIDKPCGLPIDLSLQGIVRQVEVFLEVIHDDLGS